VFSILPLSSIDQAQCLVGKSAVVADYLTAAFWILPGKPATHFNDGTSSITFAPHGR